jgi:hypothetical protein
MNKIIVGLLIALLIPQPAVANPAEENNNTNQVMDTWGNNSGLVLYTALTEGGDTLATTRDDDGDVSGKLKAGGLYHFAIGYEHRFAGAAIRATLGYKFDYLLAEDGEGKIDRIPVEITVYKRFANNHALGGGLVYELSPTYDVDLDNGYSFKADFDDALGVTVHYGYLLTDNMELGIRYTKIEYEADNLETANADSAGIYFNTFWGH